MVRLRKFTCYRSIERPYTRTSKYKEKAFIRMNPNPKIPTFQTGNSKRDFSFTLFLNSKTDLQVRDNALESAKQTANRLLEKTLGTSSYFLKLRVYPHHVLRENPIAQGAGADRFSTGMQKSFGKPIGIAARVFTGQPIFEIRINKEHLPTAKLALERASKKLPSSYSIQITENKALASAGA